MRRSLPHCRFSIRSVLAAAAWLATAATVSADEARVAVAANFTEAAREIGARFTGTTGHEVVFSFGSTGQLYTQITQDAPFEVFLAADQVRPAKAVEEGHAVAGTRFTYATGRLVLFSRNGGLVKGEATLRSGDFSKLAIANPVTAPYGAAAVEAMKALGVHDALAGRIVQGTNIAQAYQFVATGNAELGFVALSQVARHDEGSRWIAPRTLHAPIAQDTVLLKRGAGNPAAQAFIEFLKGPEAHVVIRNYGYDAGA